MAPPVKSGPSPTDSTIKVVWPLDGWAVSYVRAAKVPAVVVMETPENVEVAVSNTKSVNSA